ncbi:MAG: protein kinase [Planctomycetaceae bacterium]
MIQSSVQETLHLLLQPRVEPLLDPTVIVASDSDTSRSVRTADSGRADDRQRREPLPRTFGNYELLEEVARGGMGVVYRARQVRLNRTVALKTIRSADSASPEEVERFLIEAQAAASLQHPHIVAIHEIGECEGRHYFSMDFVEGTSLAERIRDHPLPPRQAAQYVRQAAAAIQYAHMRGVVHRDIKPSNILIDPFDQPRITDFGLAKRLDADSELTGTGAVLGTASYMPPEQASGNPRLIAPACDVYALGATLYALLTGGPPFRAETTIETLIQVLHAECVQPRLLNPGVPVDLETICLKCLEKEPTRRYASAQALAEDLQRFLDHQPIHARPASRTQRTWRWCRRNPAVAALSASLATALAAGIVGVATQWIRAEFALTDAQTQRDTAQQRLIDALQARHVAEQDLSRAVEAIDAYFVRISRDNLLNVPGMLPLRKELLEEATAFYESLFAAHPELDVGNRLSHAYQYLANAAVDLNLPEEALEANRRSLEIREQFAARFPDSPIQLSAVAVSCRATAQSLQRLGRTDEALVLAEKGDQLFKRLLKAHPDVPKFHVYSVMSDTLMADFLQRQGDSKAAVVRCQQGLQTLEAFSQNFPDTNGFDRNLQQDYCTCHWVYNALASLQMLRNDPHAIETLEEAARQWRRVQSISPAPAETQQALAETLNNIGRWNREAGRISEARDALQQARDVMEAVSRDNPEVVVYRSTLAETNRQMELLESASPPPAESISPESDSTR